MSSSSVPPLRRRVPAPQLPVAAPPPAPAAAPLNLFFRARGTPPRQRATDFSGLSQIGQALAGIGRTEAFFRGRNKALDLAAHEQAQAGLQGLTGSDPLTDRSVMLNEWARNAGSGIVEFPEELEEPGVILGSIGAAPQKPEDLTTVAGQIAKGTRENRFPAAYSPVFGEVVNDSLGAVRGYGAGQRLEQWRGAVSVYDPDQEGSLNGRVADPKQVIAQVIQESQKLNPWLVPGTPSYNPRAAAAWVDAFEAKARRFEAEAEIEFNRSFVNHFAQVLGPQMVGIGLDEALAQLSRLPRDQLDEIPGEPDVGEQRRAALGLTGGAGQKGAGSALDQHTTRLQEGLDNLLTKMAHTSGFPIQVGPGGERITPTVLQIQWLKSHFSNHMTKLADENRLYDAEDDIDLLLRVTDGLKIGGVRADQHQLYKDEIQGPFQRRSMSGAGGGLSNGGYASLNRAFMKATMPILRGLQLGVEGVNEEDAQALVAGAREEFIARMNQPGFMQGIKVQPGTEAIVFRDGLAYFESVAKSALQIPEQNADEAIDRVLEDARDNPEEAMQNLFALSTTGIARVSDPDFQRAEGEIQSMIDGHRFMFRPGTEGRPTEAYALAMGPLQNLKGDLNFSRTARDGSRALPGPVFDELREQSAQAERDLHRAFSQEIQRLRDEDKTDPEIRTALVDWARTKGRAITQPAQDLYREFRKRQEEAEVAIIDIGSRGLTKIPEGTEETFRQILGPVQFARSRAKMREGNRLVTRLNKFGGELSRYRRRLQSGVQQAIEANDELRRRAEDLKRQRQYGVREPLVDDYVDTYMRILEETARDTILEQQQVGADDPDGQLIERLESRFQELISDVQGESKLIIDRALSEGRPVTSVMDEIQVSRLRRQNARSVLDALEAGGNAMEQVFAQPPGDGREFGIPALTTVPPDLRRMRAEWLVNDDEGFLTGLFGDPTIPGGARGIFGAPPVRRVFPDRRNELSKAMLERGAEAIAELEVAPDEKPQASYDIARFARGGIPYQEVLQGRVRLPGGGFASVEDVKELAPMTTLFFETRSQLDKVLNDKVLLGNLLKQLGVEHNLRTTPDGKLQVPIRDDSGRDIQQDLATWIDLQKALLRRYENP